MTFNSQIHAKPFISFDGAPNTCFSAQNIYPQGTLPWGFEPSLVFETVENSIKSSPEARASSYYSSCLMEIRNAEINFNFPYASGVRRLSFRVICCTENPLLCFWVQEVTLVPQHMLILLSLGGCESGSIPRSGCSPCLENVWFQNNNPLIISTVPLPSQSYSPGHMAHHSAARISQSGEQTADYVATSWLT